MSSSIHPRRSLVCLSIFAAFAAALLGPAPAARADDKKAQIGKLTFKAVNDANVDALEYAIFLPNVAANQIVISKSGGLKLTKVTATPGNAQNDGTKLGVTVTFSGGTVKKSESDNITIAIHKPPKDVKTTTSIFRRNRNFTIGDTVELASRKYEPDPFYSILQQDDDPRPMEIVGLQFMSNVPEFDPESLMNFDLPFEFESPIPSFLVSTPESDLFPVPLIETGLWFHARGRVFMEGVEVGAFVHSMLVIPLPDPVWAGLAGMGILVHLRRRNFRVLKVVNGSSSED